MLTCGDHLGRFVRRERTLKTLLAKELDLIRQKNTLGNRILKPLVRLNYEVRRSEKTELSNESGGTLGLTSRIHPMLQEA